MPKAVQLKAYGGIDVLEIVDVPKPQPKPGQILVRNVAAGTNPGEISIREGLLKDMYPMDFPFGEGTDFAGVVESVGPGVRSFRAGDEVAGWVDTRSSHAEYVVAEEKQLIAKPPSLDFYRAGSLHVAGATAVAAVRAVGLEPGDVVAISGAAGGVGSIAVQLAVRAGARVLGIASAGNEAFLKSVGAECVTYGDGLEERLKGAAPNGVNAWIDLYGQGYVSLAIKLGVSKDRINTIIDFPAVQKYGIKADGAAQASDAGTLTELANLIAWGELLFPIAAIYPFDALHDAFRELAERKSHGKIVLSFDAKIGAPIHPAKAIGAERA